MNRNALEHIDAEQHYKQRYEQEQRISSLIIGLGVGFLAGLIYESIRGR